MLKFRIDAVLCVLAILGASGAVAIADDAVPTCRPCPQHGSVNPQQVSPAPGDPTLEQFSQEFPATAEDFLAFGSSKSFALGSSIAPAGVGSGTAAAMNAIPVQVIRPLVSPGLLTSANAESPYAVDRVSFSYSYYDRFQVLNTIVDVFPPAGNATSTSSRQAGFNLHRYDVTLEKTLFDGSSSIYVRAPFLDATDNIFDLPLDGVGNINAGFKTEIYRDCQTGDVFSAGLTVAAPTSRDAFFTRSQMADPINIGATIFQTVKVNPTYIQPWIGMQKNGDRMFVQAYLGLIFSTPNDVATILNPSVTVGYSLYENHCGGGTISSITPIVTVQALIPDNDDDKLLNFSDQAFVSPGLQVGLGERTSLTGGVTIPVAGPRAFDLGATVGINFLY